MKLSRFIFAMIDADRHSEESGRSEILWQLSIYHQFSEV